MCVCVCVRERERERFWMISSNVVKINDRTKLKSIC